MQMLINKMAENDKIAGNVINYIFRDAEKVAQLHQTLTSPRGDYFKLRLLNKLSKQLSVDSIEKIKENVSLKEYERHLNKLMEFRLIKKVKIKNKEYYTRTKAGEDALNAIRVLEKNIGEGTARKIYRYSLGTNSIRLFLKVYGYNKKPSFFDSFIKTTNKLEAKFKPHEIGRIALFLPRTIEGISAIDKLNLAGLLVYEEDGYVHMPPIKARSFYVYLKELYGIIKNDI